MYVWETNCLHSSISRHFWQSFIDLAGSERAAQALSAGARLKEGCHINRSLLTLGTVIRKLRYSKSSFLPFYVFDFFIIQSLLYPTYTILRSIILL